MAKIVLIFITLILAACSNVNTEKTITTTQKSPVKKESEEKSMPKNVANLNQALLKAIETKDSQQIEALLKQGAQVDTVNTRGESGLLVSTHDNNIPMAKLFLQYGANVNLQDKIEDSPFLYAGAEGRTEILKLMIPHKPDYTLTNRFGGTALIPAAEKGHLANVRLLLAETDIDVNHVNNPGWTALLEAIVLSDGSKTQQQIVQALLENGADLNIADSSGVTPLTHAKQQGYDAIADLLLSYGAK
ncbi:ankyrin repeat domain-containing protein [Listeria weihenstephanensis]|uniref:Ankyrin repeat domain-containing protein n=1 Tax=Listeria weihenstephanensis TaxID=1006155 RepID=A0A841Z2U1_9LIST|nr:ankyrin repeat domain-containing protein [Listeria weihenstephanensis]MBC1499545.1 ankyrin repeat domain-containing protein [Listeria weihenstephanensis]